ncbi:iron uptake porin [Trichocoleus desertorum AS-A10]|uniref:iron uptake porin n=1 Tax=Trichocoleus desertorum TaxID=1481672 RepID=UPI003298B2E6
MTITYDWRGRKFIMSQHRWQLREVRLSLLGLGVLGLLLIPAHSWANTPESPASTEHSTEQQAAIAYITPQPQPVPSPDIPSSESVQISQAALPSQAVPSSSEPISTIDTSITPSPALSQVTSVSQLSDVTPTDWAFQALQSLVERYGCIAGYPDGTYRGNRSLSRYEFAAGLNACLDRVNELIAAATEGPTAEDLATIRRLQEEFGAELATLRGRVDALEAQTAKLEQPQFSTTTQLRGDAIFIAADTFGDRANNTPQDDTRDETTTFFAHRTRLTLQTSFTGKDQLTTGLQASNIPNFSSQTGTQMTRFGFERQGAFEDNDLFLDRLYYRFPVNDKLTAWIGPRALQPAVFLPTLNPLVGGPTGASSRFAAFNHTLYRPGFDGAGAAVSYKFNPQLQLGLGYIVDNNQANLPESGRGIFEGNNLAIAQLTFSPSPQFDLGLTYGRKYFGNNTGFNLTGGTGSAFARNPFDQRATASDNFGVEFNWRARPILNLSGWFGYTRAHQLSGGDNDATILHGALTVAFPDLFAKGNLGGFVVGVPPKATSNDYRSRPGAAPREDVDTSLHLEAFYTLRLTDNISVTPNVFVVTAPEHNDANDAIWVGALRTNFSF